MTRPSPADPDLTRDAFDDFIREIANDVFSLHAAYLDRGYPPALLLIAFGLAVSRINAALFIALGRTAPESWEAGFEEFVECMRGDITRTLEQFVATAAAAGSRHRDN